MTAMWNIDLKFLEQLSAPEISFYFFLLMKIFFDLKILNGWNIIAF